MHHVPRGRAAPGLLSLMACQRKTKVNFNEEELEVLVKAYDGGMNSVSKGKFHLIQDVASKLEKSEQEIKVAVCVNLNVA